MIYIWLYATAETKVPECDKKVFLLFMSFWSDSKIEKKVGPSHGSVLGQDFMYYVKDYCSPS